MSELLAAADLIVRIWHSPDPIAVVLALNHLELLGLSGLGVAASTLVYKLVKWLSRRFR
jgi:hypothetical protein